MDQDLILEIGVEDLPARMMPATLTQLRQETERELARQRLAYTYLSTYATPRRIALYVTGLAAGQQDLVEEIKGPPARVAFDAGGAPTKAALGFARNQGVEVAALTIRSDDNGSYVYACRQNSGRPAVEVLPELLPRLITGLTFPHSMRWGDQDLRFIRPIRWLLALFGDAVIPFNLAGVVSGRETRGHRFLNPATINLERASDYLPRLEQANVIVDHHRRRQLIEQQLQQQAANLYGKLEPDTGLLEEVAFLVEWPTVLSGSFNPDYLELPPEVLVTSMREHQRYFPVIDPSHGGLLPHFLTVRDGDDRRLEVVRTGNQRVLRARLADAVFFYHEDLKQPLELQLERLQAVVFQADLGSVYDKVQRLQKLVAMLTDLWSLDSADGIVAGRAALLAKADLVSKMVYEFPELQGIMGGYYATQQGEAAGVAMAIAQHYRPRAAGDAPPSTLAGAVVSIADKLDTVVGCFAAGIQPTGSHDPYGLRRLAQGVCTNLWAWKLPLSLEAAIRFNYTLYGKRVKLHKTVEETIKLVKDFFQLRVQSMLEEEGLPYDVINSVVASSWQDPLDVRQRALALAVCRDEPELDALRVAFSRAANLGRQATTLCVDPGLFQTDVEHLLWQAFQQVKQEADRLRQRTDWDNTFKVLGKLREPVDSYFAGVLVMAADADIKSNRLATLANLAEYIRGIADLSQLVESAQH